MLDFQALAASLLARADELVPSWLPDGKRRGREWVCGDLRGSPGDSCSVNLNTGMWADFASNDRGGDLISLYAAIHGIEQGAAARELGGDDQPRNGHVVSRVSRETSDATPEPLLPAPADAGLPPEPRGVTVEDVHEYRTFNGALVGVVQRCLSDAGKTFRQWRWDGERWAAKAMPEPRPLYGLPALKQRPDAPVLVVEGERCADVAAAVLPKYVIVTWPGGAKAWKKADWSALATRKRVDLWPDNDAPGREAVGGIALALYQLGVETVNAIDPAGRPDGWDIADAVSDGMTGNDILLWARPLLRSIDRPKQATPPVPAPVEPPSVGELIAGTDMAFARRLHTRHGHNLKFSIERAWLVWSGSRWQIDDKGVLVSALAKESAESMLDEIRDARDRNEAFKVAKLAAQKRAIEAAVWLARSESGVLARLVDFDVDAMLLNVQNGIVDLSSGKLMPHDKNKLCSMMAGTRYDPTAHAPRWRSFIGEVTGENIDLMDYLQTLCGYLLTASVAEHCMAFLYGLGRNGKSVFLETLQSMMGDYACSAAPELVMASKHQGIPNDVARLRGIRAVFMNETEQGARFAESKLKQLTGGDTLNARFLREEFFDFKPTHKLVMRGNYQPTVNGTDDGIWSRIRLVPFTQSFLGREDRTLPDALRGELPGVLNWAIEGCLRWQREGLVTPAVVSDAVNDYRSESDTLGRFITDHCEARPAFDVKSAAFFKKYRQFCEDSGERWVSSKMLPHEMERRGFKQKRLASGVVFLGIQIAATQQDWHGSSGDF